jgi:C_GCAxxG_C_C family probable redox protein
MINELEKKITKAISFFENGYNCSQAVFMAYADILGLEQETAAKIGTSFGGGMGRMREVCGAVSGMFLVLGMYYPATDPKNKDSKTKNYEAVQRTAKEFKAQMGSYICADLLKTKHQPENPEPAERNAKYYELRPCTRCVALAAQIVGAEINLDC